MPRSPRWPPPVHHHRKSGQDRVRIAGRDVYLGPHGSPRAREKYLRVIAEAGGPEPRISVLDASTTPITVAELAARYLQMMKARYPNPRGNTCEYRESLYAFRVALDLYGSLPATEFGPKAFKAVRQAMRDRGLRVTVTNHRMARIRRAFKWGTEEELLPPATWHALQAVRRLPQPAARPQPVPIETILAVLPHVRPVVADMIQVQLFTGCRPGELCIMRPCDFDRSGEVWLYRPAHHKTLWKGQDRIVPIGPRAQAILTAYLNRPGEAYLFSPAEAMGLLRAEQKAKRRGKGKARNWRKARPKRKPGACYCPGSYNYAIRRGCRKAGVAPFHAHQLRHTAATAFRESGGLDAAQSLLGHQSQQTTEIYAGLPGWVLEVVRKIG